MMPDDALETLAGFDSIFLGCIGDAGKVPDHISLEALLDSLGLEDPQGRLFLPKLRELPVGLQRRVLFNYLKANKIGDLSRDLVDRCVGLLDPDNPAKENLPGGRHLRRRAILLGETPPSLKRP